MSFNRTHNLNVSIGVALGIALYQLAFAEQFDFYRPLFIGLFTFIILSLISAFSSSDDKEVNEYLASENEANVPYSGFGWWLWNVLVAIDQLGNTLAGGKADITISARVGYYANYQVDPKLLFYWKFLERVINLTFYPLDGHDHCIQALEEDNETGHVHGNDLMRGILGLIIIFACIPISIFTWGAYLLGLRPKSRIRDNQI